MLKTYTTGNSPRRRTRLDCRASRGIRSSHACDVAARIGRISQDGPSIVGALRFGDNTRGVHHAIPDSQRRAVEQVAGVLDLDGLARASKATSKELVN